MTLSVQFDTLLSMIVMGILFGALLDTYQRFLNRPVRSRWIAFICDVIFWCAYGGLLFYCLYAINYGEVRFYIFLAVFCGFSAYQALFKSIYVKVLNGLILLFIRLFQLIRKSIALLVVMPIAVMLRWIIALIRMIGKSLLSLVKAGLRLLLFIVKVACSPILLIWRMLPSKLRRPADRLRKKAAGVFLIVKNKIVNTANRWKK
ncbi:spore cortex biosynthesis protein YabQ [Bacillus xiapuensis]|uniref:spore cortex biosynthesis protein YabQ n=1 Tax=Bacillus xiapuensis TaxID=2014075 RepID=UPI000C248CF0|nr:spore cortex biosynthesis protein YabQ [Bacillus xiapuensis]